MTIFFVSRHPGAREWATRRGYGGARFLTHLEDAQAETLGPGDAVLGTLPVHVAARVCATGARYFHLAMDLPAAARGRELSFAEMETYDARLQRCDVRMHPDVAPDLASDLPVV